MVVVAAQPVGGFALMLSDRIDDSGVNQGQECPVHGGQTHASALLARLLVDLLGRQCPLAIERVHDGNALRRAAQPVASQGVGGIHHVDCKPTDVGRTAPLTMIWSMPLRPSWGPDTRRLVRR